MPVSARMREEYAHFLPIHTRWADNDAYGHVNNVVYYSWFDTVVNQFLIEHEALNIAQSTSIGLVVETQCNYFAPLSFPEQVQAGLRVVHIGNTSVRYQIGIFAIGQNMPAAQGHFVHVYVDRHSRRPCPIPPHIQHVLQTIFRTE